MISAPAANSKLTVEVCRDADAPEWDEFVLASGEGSACHLWAWREIMARTLGHDALMLMARDEDGACQGVLPIVRVRSALFGHYVVSMPFLNDGGPLGSAEAVDELVTRAVQESRKPSADLLEMRTRATLRGAQRISDRKITVQLPLPGTPDELWCKFPGKLRSQIKRARRERFDVRFGADQCGPFYEVFAQGMRALGTPVLPREWFDGIARLLPDHAEFAVVWDGDEPIAAGCGFHWQRSFEITWAASLLQYRPMAPNMLLYWSLMERAIAKGATLFDFGRCTPGGGTHKFKTQWGGVDVPLPWAQWSPGNVAATPSPEKSAYRFGAYCWKHLPLSVTNRVGPMLARQLP